MTIFSLIMMTVELILSIAIFALGISIIIDIISDDDEVDEVDDRDNRP